MATARSSASAEGRKARLPYVVTVAGPLDARGRGAAPRCCPSRDLPARGAAHSGRGRRSPTSCRATSSTSRARWLARVRPARRDARRRARRRTEPHWRRACPVLRPRSNGAGRRRGARRSARSPLFARAGWPTAAAGARADAGADAASSSRSPAGSTAPSAPAATAAAVGPELGASLAVGLACRTLVRRLPVRGRLVEGARRRRRHVCAGLAAGRLPRPYAQSRSLAPTGGPSGPGPRIARVHGANPRRSRGGGDGARR